MENKKYKAIVIGVSSGGMAALKAILPSLPSNFSMPVIIVQHIGVNSENHWIDILSKICRINIKEADEKEKIIAGTVYVAPANYHLLIEKDETFSLSIDERVNYARPSIDILFETAAETFKEHLIGIILTGSNNDGAAGLKKIKDCGGIVIVQDPATAESGFMPSAAIASTRTNNVLPIEKITELLIQLNPSYEIQHKK